MIKIYNTQSIFALVVQKNHCILKELVFMVCKIGSMYIVVDIEKSGTNRLAGSKTRHFSAVAGKSSIVYIPAGLLSH